MNKDYGEIICSAVDSIVQARMNNLEFNITKTCTIVDIKQRKQGKYTVSDGSVRFEALSEDTSYNLDDSVLVLIPNGDYQNNKLILGKTKVEDDLPYNYISPMSMMVKFTDNVLNNNDFGAALLSPSLSLVANQCTENATGSYVQLYEFINNGDFNGYSRIGLAGDFQALLRNYGVREGTYGIRLEIDSDEVSAAGEHSTHVNVFSLVSEDMAGNPYAFDTYFTQEKVFDISHIKNILALRIYFYQNANFKTGEGNLISAYNENSIGDEPELLQPNLFVENLKLYFGYSVSEFDKETLVVYSEDTPSYHYKNENNEKTLMLRWIHKVDDNTFIPLSGGYNLDTTKYEVRWFKYDATCRTFDQYAGPNWTRLEAGTSDFSIKFTPDTKKSKEQIKVVGLIKEDSIVSYSSNIFDLTNEEYVPDNVIFDVAAGLTIGCLDGTSGNYFLYDQNGKLTNTAIGQGYVRTLLPLWNGEPIKSQSFDENTIDYIQWWFPHEDTMLSLLETADNIASYDGVNYKVYEWRPSTSDWDAAAPGVDYSIANYWIRQDANNSVRCVMSWKGTEYTAIKELQFGRSGTNGSNYTMVLEFAGGKNAISIEDGTAVIEARLYDGSGSRIDFTSTQDDKIQWSWFKPLDGFNSYIDIIEPATSKLPESQRQLKLKDGVTAPPVDNYHIIQADYTYSDLGAKITAFLQIPIKKNICSHIDGAKEIVYNNQGVPSYYNDAFAAYHRTEAKSYINMSVNWEYTPIQSDSVDYTQPALTKDADNKSFILAPQFYLKGQNDQMCVYAKSGNDIVWSQPILIIQSEHDFAMLNSWSHGLTFDEKSGTILSTMLGAGKKDPIDNTYSGVLIGDIKGGTGLNDTEERTGVYGIHKGVLSYGFMEDGTGFIGKKTGGRIILDGNNGYIASQNWFAAGGEFKNGGLGGSAEAGMAIDLQQGHIDAYNFKLKSYGIQMNSNPDNGDRYIYIGDSDKHLFYGLNSSGQGEFAIKASNFNLDTAGNVEMSGTIYARAGRIGCDANKSGGWTINANSIYTADKNLGEDGSFYMYSAGTQSSSITIAEHSGSDWRLGIGSNFGVTNAGNVYCNNGEFRRMSAKTGTIAGWTFDANKLAKNSVGDDVSFVLSTADQSGTVAGKALTNWRLAIGKNFGVTSGGALYCTSGSIGGWNISTSGIYKNDYTYYFGSPTTIGGISNVVLRANSTFYVLSDGTMYCNKGYIGGAAVDGSSIGSSGNSGTWSVNKSGYASFTGGKVGGWYMGPTFTSTRDPGEGSTTPPTTGIVVQRMTSSRDKLTIYKNGDLILEDGSDFTMKKGGTMSLNDGSNLTVNAGGKIIISGSGGLSIGGSATVTIATGGILNFSNGTFKLGQATKNGETSYISVSYGGTTYIGVTTSSRLEVMSSLNAGYYLRFVYGLLVGYEGYKIVG